MEKMCYGNKEFFCSILTEPLCQRGKCKFMETRESAERKRLEAEESLNDRGLVACEKVDKNGIRIKSTRKI